MASLLEALPSALPTTQGAENVLRRLRALSRIAGRLPSFEREDQLLGEVADGLYDYFVGANEVRLVLVAPSGNTATGFRRCRNGLREAIESPGIDSLAVDDEDRLLTPKWIPSDPNEGCGAKILAPLIEGTSLLGLITIEVDPAADDFEAADLDMLAGVAAQVSMAVHRLRASGRLHTRRRLERDLEIARQVQQSFLPRLPTQLNGLRLAALYRPAYQIGGDFYEVVPVEERRVMASIGDVSGKGISGALLMARFTSELRRLSGLALTPCEILIRLNDIFAQQICDDIFVTAACVLFDAEKRTLTVANAGHVPPLLRKRSGEVSTFGDPSGPPIAMLAGQRYVDEQMVLDPGDIVVLATDGVFDALHTDEDPLGLECLRRLLSALPPDVEDINRRLTETVKLQSEVQADDVTLLTLEVI